MSASDLQLFINPSAGRGRAGKRLPRIRQLLEDAGLSVTVHQSGSVGDLERQVRAHAEAGAQRLLIAGGDGSIHEAANGILLCESDAGLGIIPSGTGNDFAKAADIPVDWESATRLLADRVLNNVPPRRIDAANMNGRYFANGAGIGLDAKVTSVARSYRLPIGDLVYLLAIFRTMTEGIATPEIIIEADGLDYTGPLTLASISNGPWIGGMFHIAPMANNHDGLLELLIVEPVTRKRILSLLPKLMQGEHTDEPEVTHASIRRVRIESQEPVPSHLDGEVQPLTSKFEIEILPEALRLL